MKPSRGSSCIGRLSARGAVPRSPCGEHWWDRPACACCVRSENATRDNVTSTYNDNIFSLALGKARKESSEFCNHLVHSHRMCELATESLRASSCRETQLIECTTRSSARSLRDVANRNRENSMKQTIMRRDTPKVPKTRDERERWARAGRQSLGV